MHTVSIKRICCSIHWMQHVPQP